jgi:hypothetical protein
MRVLVGDYGCSVGRGCGRGISLIGDYGCVRVRGSGRG